MPERVVIIGTGAAGLAAAGELARAGMQPLLLEARRRTGGRIDTLSDGERAPIELGAEFMHGLAPDVDRLAREHHLAKSEVIDEHWKVRSGKFEELPDFWGKLGRVFEKIPEKGRDRSYVEFVGALRGLDDSTRCLARDYVEGFHGADPERISIQSIAQSEAASERINGTKQFRFVAGYGELVHAMEARAIVSGARVLLNHAVSRLEWRPGRVHGIARHGEELRRFEAAAAIITLPLGVLRARSVVFDPPLPEIDEAVASLETGNVIKVNLRLRPGLWPDDKPGFIHLATEEFPTLWKRRDLVTAWAGGPKADRHGSSADIIHAAIDALSAVFGRDARPFVETAQFHNWRNDPFARGAYSYVPLGGLKARDILARPVQRTLFFAGEATAQVGTQATVHGAIESGLRAARAVLDR
jgi:monoamine oxidase